MTKQTEARIGSSFDDFLKENAIYEEVTARAINRVIARLSALKDDLDSGFRPAAGPGRTEETTSPPRAARRR
jgi:hypothetical protein